MKYINYFPCGTKSKPFNSLDLAVDDALNIRFGVVEVRPFNGQPASVPFGWKHKKSLYVTKDKDGDFKVK